MNKISIEELENKIEAGEEVIDTYFAHETTRKGTAYPTVSRRQKELIPTNLDLPRSMLSELDVLANELEISREAVIKMMLRQALDEHYLALKQLQSKRSH